MILFFLVRPWATQKGIQLIQEAVAKSSYLADEDFSRLIESVQKCMLHVIGDRNTTSRNQSASDPNNIFHHHNPLFYHHHQQYHHIKASHSMSDSMRDHITGSGGSGSGSGSVSAGIDPSLADAHTRHSAQQLSSTDLIAYTRSSSLSSQTRQLQQQQQQTKAIKVPPRQRFGTSCLAADQIREDVLLKKRYIGKILENKNNISSPIFNSTEVSFRWQLGLLIGKWLI